VPTASKSKHIAPPPKPVSRARIDEGDVVIQPRRSLVSLALGVVVVITVVWGGIRLFGGNEPPPPSAEVASTSPGTSGSEQPASPSASHGQSTSPEQGAPAAPPINAKSRPNANEKLPSNPKAALNGKLTARSIAPGAATNASSAAAVRQFIPEVPQRARRTIRGNVRVSVRVIVEQDGSVFAALAERRGPSRYFERVAIDAAKKWTFTPTEAEAQRLMLVKFAFNREGTTAEAVALN
jgi:TonB family protein